METAALLLIVFTMSTSLASALILLTGSGGRFEKVVASIALISFVGFMIVFSILEDSKEYKEKEIGRCEWILDNKDTFLIYGEPNK